MAGFKVGSIFDGTLLSPIMDGVEFGSTRHSWLKPGLEQMVLPGALWWNAIFSTAPCLFLYCMSQLCILHSQCPSSSVLDVLLTVCLELCPLESQHEIVNVPHMREEAQLLKIFGI